MLLFKSCLNAFPLDNTGEQGTSPALQYTISAIDTSPALQYTISAIDLYLP